MRGTTIKNIDLDNERFQVLYDAIEEFCPEDRKGEDRDLDVYLNRLRSIDQKGFEWSPYFAFMDKVHAQTDALLGARGDRVVLRDSVNDFIGLLTAYAKTLEDQKEDQP